MNGFPIETIEKRARPGAWAASGFIGQNESLKEVLQNDWKTVEALGATHIGIANHLKAIWNRTESNLKEQPIEGMIPLYLRRSFIPFSCTRVKVFALGVIMGVGSLIAAYSYSPRALSALLPAAGCVAFSLHTKKVDPIKEEPLSLTGRIKMYYGKQEDIFGERVGWGCDLEITNTKNNLSVTIGEGVIDYIERYGFYEGGGEGNPYCVDPLKLVAFLTGSTIFALEEKMKK